LVGDLVEQERLHQLGLRQRRGDLEQRLAREDDPPLGNGPDLATEAQAPQWGHLLDRATQGGRERRHVFVIDVQPLQVAQCLLEAGSDEEPSIWRQLPGEQAERGRFSDALTEVRERHRYLVQVRHKGVRHRNLRASMQTGESIYLMIPKGPHN
jgi:hypothetical protein